MTSLSIGLPALLSPRIAIQSLCDMGLPPELVRPGVLGHL